MKKETKAITTVFIIFCLLCFFIGLTAGTSWQTNNLIKIGQSIQIEEMNIDLNETRMTEAMMDYFEKQGLLDELKQAKLEQEKNG